MWYHVTSERTIPTDRDLMLAVEDTDEFAVLEFPLPVGGRVLDWHKDGPSG